MRFLGFGIIGFWAGGSGWGSQKSSSRLGLRGLGFRDDWCFFCF